MKWSCLARIGTVWLIACTGAARERAEGPQELQTARAGRATDTRVGRADRELPAPLTEPVPPEPQEEAAGLEQRVPPAPLVAFGPLGGRAPSVRQYGQPSTAPVEVTRMGAPTWAGLRIARDDAPAAALAAWEQAPNHARCALLVPSAGAERGVAHGARTPGGWGVAWDVEGARGETRDGTPCATCGGDAFGIQGTRLEVVADPSAGMTFRREWTDGSRAQIGREPGENTADRPFVALLQVPGQGCVYRLWSHLGRPHLELLLEHLQWVAAR